jgi:hypothetical protein
VLALDWETGLDSPPVAAFQLGVDSHMPSREVPLAERVSTAYPRLASAASELNKASDDLAKAIAPIETILSHLNLGVPTWVEISGSDDGSGRYWSRDVGYTKLSFKWGLAIRTTEGHHGFGEHSEEVWPFNEAPRWMRIDAISKVPDLIEALIKRTEETTKKIQGKTKQAAEIAAALAAAANTSKTDREKA